MHLEMNHLNASLRLFSHESKVQFEWSFEWWYFGPCVCKIMSRCAIQMTVQRYFPVTHLSNHAAKMPWPLNCDLGGGGMWPSNHFRLYTVRCICTEAQETWAPCMFDWQGTQTRAMHLFPLWNAKPQIWSLVSILRNSNIAVTSLVCTLRNSNCALCSRVKWWHSYLLRWWHDTYRFCLSYLNDMGNGTLFKT